MKTKKEITPTTLSRDAFYRLIAQGVVADGRAGGFLSGRRKDQGGILVIRQDGDDFTVQSERLEGGDFVMSEEVPGRERLSLEQRQRIPLPSPRIICTEARPDDKILWLTKGQEVVRRVNSDSATLLTRLNEYQNPYAFSDLEDIFEPTL